MKTLLLGTTLMLFVATIFVSCKDQSKNNLKESNTKNQASTTDLLFNDEQAKKQFQHYIHIKTALLKANVDEAKSGAIMLIKNTNDADFKAMLSKISEARNIDIQRAAFSGVTESMSSIVKGALSSGKVYKQFCPMALNNQGGYWLSTEKEIRNPYFGDQMLKCGRVTEIIK